MANTPDPKKQEHPSTYMVQDRANQEEVLRVDEQDYMYTSLMGGVLPEHKDEEPTRFQRVLDVGCGTGGWLIKMAQTYPSLPELYGIDISAHMKSYAQKKVEDAGVGQRVQFQTGDALRQIEFPNTYFDLVNQRLGLSYLRTWDWPNILREYRRVCKPRGIIRITECSLGETNGPASAQLGRLFQDALYNAGHLFTNEPDGVIAHLAGQMETAGIVDVQTKKYVFVYHDNPRALQAIVKDMHRVFHTIIPFLRKWTKFPDNYEDLYQEMVRETQQPNFQASAPVITAWGTRYSGSR